MTQPWFSRRFAPVAPDLLPSLIERLRGTPARLDERLRSTAVDRLIARRHDTWSIQENVGHLGDLEILWRGRIDDFAAGVAALRPADLDNRATHDAHHNRADLGTLLCAFRRRRAELVLAIEAMAPALRTRTALHPRLQLPMSPADLAFFVAEHDDHHLARIGELLRDTAVTPGAAAPSPLLLFFVVERFRPGRSTEVYQRFRERGRLAPDGLHYVASWVDLDYQRCFQVMAAEREQLVHEWTANWRDLVDFEIVPVRTSADAAAAMAAR